MISLRHDLAVTSPEVSGYLQGFIRQITLFELRLCLSSTRPHLGNIPEQPRL